MTIEQVATQYGVTPSMVQAFLDARKLSGDEGLQAYIDRRTIGSIN